MICLGIVEDEKHCRDMLKEYCARFSRERGVCLHVELIEDGDSFFAADNNYDILLLDICLGEGKLDGMGLARRFRETHKDTVIMFVTNLIQYAVDGYAVNAFHYIVKPVDYGSFAEKLLRAVERCEEIAQSRISVRTRAGMQCLQTNGIRFVETSGHKLLIHSGEGIYESHETLQSMESLLPAKWFFRCHVAYLVNLRYVERIDKSSALVAGEEVPISRHRKREFMNALANCLGNNAL